MRNTRGMESLLFACFVTVINEQVEVKFNCRVEILVCFQVVDPEVQLFD